MAGLFALVTPANADCSGAERAKIAERMVGVWGLKLSDGSKSCITFRYQADGNVIQASNDHCANGGKAGSSTKHWRIDDACKLVMTGPNESGTPRAVHLVDGNKEIVVDAGNGPITLVRK